MITPFAGWGKPTAGTTQFAPAWGSVYSWNATEANRRMVIPYSGVFQNLRLNCTTPPGVGESVVITLRIAGSDKTLTATLSGTDTVAVDLAHTDAYSMGTYVALKAVSSAGSAIAGLSWTLDFNGTGDATAQPIMGCIDGGGSAFDGTSTYYF